MVFTYNHGDRLIHRSDLTTGRRIGKAVHHPPAANVTGLSQTARAQRYRAANPEGVRVRARVGTGPDHRVVGAVRLPARPGRPGTSRAPSCSWTAKARAGNGT